MQWFRDHRSPMDAYTEHRKGAALTHRETLLVVFGVLLPTFMGSLDQTILATALPIIGRDFGDVQQPALADHRLHARLDGGDPALRQDRRHPRPALHAAHRDPDLHGRLAGLRARAQHVGADLRPRAARPGRRRAVVDGHDRARRPRVAEGARPLLQLFRHHLYDGRRLRPGARRLHRRVPALVGDLLDQHPDGAGGAGDHHVPAAPAAALRAAAPPRHRRRDPDRDRERVVHAGAEPGRRALCLDVAADARAVRGGAA